MYGPYDQTCSRTSKNQDTDGRSPPSPPPHPPHLKAPPVLTSLLKLKNTVHSVQPPTPSRVSLFCTLKNGTCCTPPPFPHPCPGHLYLRAPECGPHRPAHRVSQWAAGGESRDTYPFLLGTVGEVVRISV
jgi:hypothetical protein